MNNIDELQEFLDAKVAQYNRPAFIEKDPISIPHRFTRRQDIEIMGFWAAVLAWGQRPVILKKAGELIQLMDEAPYDFVRNHEESDLKRFLAFKHRTFNATDALYFLHFFRQYYQQHDSLEDAFDPASTDFSPLSGAAHGQKPVGTVGQSLIAFHDRFCCDPFFPARTRKHIATPARNSSCKRLLMFLRWMVRRDNCGVDFGLWTRLSPADLVMPIDVHVGRVARTLGLLSREQTDWQAALALTDALRPFDPTDPVKYDFALFGLGVEGEL
nr:TIGR02757 family protein [Tellurirhabdus rosea]